MMASDRMFINAFACTAKAVHDNAIAKKFVKKGEKRNEGELIALAHSELSECLDFIRRGNPPSDHIPEFSGAEEELADCVIRCMDHSVQQGYRLAEAIVAKMKFNATRPAMHGGKKF